MKRNFGLLMNFKRKALLFIVILLTNLPVFGQDFKVDKVYRVKEAKQGVAVDEDFFYVINNKEVAKYAKENGKLEKQWADTTNAIKHLNSGKIVNGKLYCAHSNYPDSPMASSIEVFDPVSLRHIENISFGINIGSATWLDYYNGHWYVAFAHYSDRGSTENKTNKWTQLVQFSDEWQRLQSWIFPKELLEKFGTRSNSGGVIADDGTLYITGHDNKELYQLAFPDMGYTLLWQKTYAIPYEGQGIALERSTTEELILYGIVRKENKVLKTVILK